MARGSRWAGQLRAVLAERGVTSIPWHDPLTGYETRQPITLTLRSRVTRREMLAGRPDEAERTEKARAFGIDLDAPDTITWQVSRPVMYDDHRSQPDREGWTYDQWLAWCCRDIPDGYDIVPERGERITGYQAAKIAGVTPSTWRAYVSRGQAPQPVQQVGRTPLWDRTQVDAWQKSRPGRGRWGRRVPS